MTCEEARRILMSDADFSGVGEKSEQTADALCAAIDALEKQIPKKPKNFLRNIHTQEYLCPLCKIRIISKINGEFIAGSKDKYCSHCGQAIDWNGDN